MQNKTSIKANKLVFSKWSRKAYAVFASLGRVVKIAQLKVDICNQAIKKNINILTEFAELKIEKLIRNFEEIVDLFVVQMLEGLIVIQDQKTEQHQVIYRNKEYNQIRPDFFVADF